MGATLGWLGAALSQDIRVAAATLLGFAAVAVGGSELAGRRPRLLQRNVETPQRWLYRSGNLTWAVMNGAALGAAVVTRLGFSLWYVIPASSFLVGDPVFGGCIYGVYAFTRTATVYPLLRWATSVPDSAAVTDILRSWQPGVRRVCAGTLTGVGIVVIATVGL